MMQIGHIRLVAFGKPEYGVTIRLDTLLPERMGLSQRYKSRLQAYRSLWYEDGPEAVMAKFQELCDELKRKGVKPSECEAPPMLKGCQDPPKEYCDALRAALGATNG